MEKFFGKGNIFYIGIDLGGKEKRTTGVCVIAKNKGGILSAPNWCQKCEDIRGKDVLLKIRPYLKNTKAIAIDAPLTKGRGKGEFRLYEKFLSTKIFRAEKVNPLPPALMPKFCDFARDLKNKLERRGFILDINLIGVFPTLIKKLCRPNLTEVGPLSNLQRTDLCQTKNQKSALICAILAELHSNFKTRWLGYKDGFLFLPEMSFWEKSWKQKFYQAWTERDRLKYRRLITNVFEEKLWIGEKSKI